jgi:hypothetical protein
MSQLVRKLSEVEGISPSSHNARVNAVLKTSLDEGVDVDDSQQLIDFQQQQQQQQQQPNSAAAAAALNLLSTSTASTRTTSSVTHDPSMMEKLVQDLQVRPRIVKNKQLQCQQNF